MDFHFDDMFEQNSSSQPFSAREKTPFATPYERGDNFELEDDEEAGDFEDDDATDDCGDLDIVDQKKRTLEDFGILKHVGSGAYGRVYQVKEVVGDKVFAMKLLKKSYLVKTNSVQNTITERDVLRKVRHPFIVRLHYTFQTVDRVAFIMDFVQGGQLFFHLRNEAVFDEPTVRFYTAELVLALEHLHEHHIIHRDLKPENILVSSDGHIVLTDFGLAKEQVVDHDSGATTWCGTIEYMAPEMLQGKNYGKAADFWSVGILIFDMLNGRPPFRDKNAKKLSDMICTKKILMPQFWKAETHSIIKGLTLKDPKSRLKVQQIKSHAFFKGVSWDKLVQRLVPPPFLPKLDGNLDLSNFDEEDLKHSTTFSPADPVNAEHADLFEGFSYTRPVTPHDVKVPAGPTTAIAPTKFLPSLIAASDNDFKVKGGKAFITQSSSKYHDIN